MTRQLAMPVDVSGSRKEGGIDAVCIKHCDRAICLPLVPYVLRMVLDERSVVTNQVSSVLLVDQGSVRRLQLRGKLNKIEAFDGELCKHLPDVLGS